MTSEIRRPLAGGLDGTGEEGFELFTVLDEVGTLPESGPGEGGEQPDPVDPPGGPGAQDRPIEEQPINQQEPEGRIGEPVERQAQLPGLRDALGWFRRYWNWINQPA